MIKGIEKRYLHLLLFAALIFVVACSGNDASNEEGAVEQTEESVEQNDEVEQADSDETDTEDGTETASEGNDASQNEEDTNDEANTGTEQSSSSGNKDLPDPIEINDRVQTETGLIFEVEKITFEEDHIAVDFNADNMSGFSKTLASKGAAQNTNLGGITLQDDNGFDYRYVAEHGDARIVVDNQEKVEGTVRFLGRVQDNANTLTLIFNPGNSPEDSAPNFTYEDIKINW